MPGMVRNHISRFESLARKIVEGSVGRLIGNDNLALQIAAELSGILEDSAARGRQPSVFHIVINPRDLQAMGTRSEEFERRLARYISSFSQTGPLRPNRKTTVRLIPDETLPYGEVAIEVKEAKEAGDTTDVLSSSIAKNIQQLALLDAFLIVNGRRHVALDRPLITIGRRVDNDVIIDSPAVSRQHAHIRWRHGRFVIYDVGSKGGVQVNGERVSESVLAAGDLITLSERVPLIYGEGLENRQALQAANDRTQDTLAYSSDDEFTD